MFTINYIKLIIDTFISKYTNPTSPIYIILNFVLELLVYNLHPDPYKRMRKTELQKILNIIFNTKNISYDTIIKFVKENHTILIEESSSEQNFITPNFSIFKDKKILDFIKSINKDIDLQTQPN